MSYCKKCGSPMNDTDRFCNACGTIQNPIGAQDNYDREGRNRAYVKTKKRSEVAIIFTILGALALILLIIIGSFLFYYSVKSNGSSFKNTTSTAKLYNTGDVVFLQMDAKNISPADFMDTAEAINKRLEAAGVENFKVSGLGKDKIKIDFKLKSDRNTIIKAVEAPEGDQIRFLTDDGAVIVTNNDIASAKAAMGENNNPLINIKFNSVGTGKFMTATEKNIGKKISIYYGDKLLTAPVVQEVITSGEIVITGMSTLEKAKRIANNIGILLIHIKVRVIEGGNITVN